MTDLTPSLPDEHEDKKPTEKMSYKETREWVTPYAFKVSDELLGTPLAGPYVRGLALSLDLFFIAMLTHVSSVFLAGLVAVVFFRAGNKLEKKQRFGWGRKVLRFGAALLLFVFSVGVFDAFNDNVGSNVTAGSNVKELGTLEGLAAVGVTAAYVARITATRKQISEGACAPAFDCWDEVLTEMATDVAELGLQQKQAANLFKGMAEETELVSQQQAQLLDNMNQAYKQNIAPAQDVDSLSGNEESQGASDNIVSLPVSDSTESNYSIIEWAKTLAEDLGLGVGWAAFYFTVFTAWWGGQTPGKRVFGLKVLKLDGSGLNLWDSFGRYGGYGAGLATGLLGFLQIFWDPNRQAIQDKISETLVINLRKPKAQLTVESAQQEYSI